MKEIQEFISSLGFPIFICVILINLFEGMGMKHLFRYQRTDAPYNGIVVMGFNDRINVQINSNSRMESKDFYIPTTEDIKISLIVVNDATLLLINDDFATFNNTPEFENAKITLGTTTSITKIKSLKLSYDYVAEKTNLRN